MDKEKEKSGSGKAAENEEKEFSLFNELFDWVEAFIFASFIVLLVFIFLFRTVIVDGDSMNPTLFNAQRLVLTHFNYTPERGDIIVCNSHGLNKTIIKRCIGVAGDTVLVNYASNSVFVNGEKVDEPYLDASRPMMDMPYFNDDYRISENAYEYVVPDGAVFAMGDNRNGSNDSRSADIGFIYREDILGRAVFRFYIGNNAYGEKNPGKIGFLE